MASFASEAARRAQYHGFIRRSVTAYVVTSVISILIIMGLINNISLFVLAELSQAIKIVLPVVAIAAAAQYILIRIELVPFRNWAYSVGKKASIRDVYMLMLRFPMRSAHITFIIWFSSTLIYVTLLYWVAEIPGIRIGQIAVAVMGAGLISTVLQFSLVRLFCRKILEHHSVFKDNAPDLNANFASLRTRYTLVYIALLASILLEGGLLSYSTVRQQTLEKVYDHISTVMSLARDMRRTYPDFYEDNWRILERGLHMRLYAGEDNLAVPNLSSYYAEPIRKYGLELYEMERQVVPRFLAVKEDLGQGQYLFLEYDMTNVDAHLTSELVQVLLVYLCLFAMGTGLLVLFIRDASRPLQRLRDFFDAGDGNYLRIPDLSYSDDEAGQLSIAFVRSLTRLNNRIRLLKDKFWVIRDGKRNLRDDLLRFSEDLDDQKRVNDKFRHAIDRINDQSGTVLKEIERLSEEGTLANTSLLKISETVVTTGSIAQDLSNVSRDLETSLYRYNEGIQEAYASSESGERVHRDLMQQFIKVEDTLNGITEALGQYGSGQDEMLKGLSLRRTHLAEMRAESINALLLFKRIREQTQAFTSSFQVVQDSVSKLSEVKDETDILGFQTTIVASQSPGFQREFLVVADEMKELADRIEGSVQSVQKNIQSLTQDATETLTDFLHLDEPMAHAIRLVNSQEARTDEADGNVRETRVRLQEVNHGVGSLEQEVEQLTQTLREHRDAVQESQQAFEKQLVSARESLEAMQVLRTTIQTTAGNLDFQQRYFSGLGDMMPKISDSIRVVRRQSRRIREITEQLQAKLNQRTDLVKTELNRIDGVLKVFDAADEVIDSSERQIRQISRFVR